MVRVFYCPYILKMHFPVRLRFCVCVRCMCVYSSRCLCVCLALCRLVFSSLFNGQFVHAFTQRYINDQGVLVKGHPYDLVQVFGAQYIVPNLCAVFSMKLDTK